MMESDQFEVIEPDPPKRSWFKIVVIVGMVAMVAYGLWTVQCAPSKPGPAWPQKDVR